MNPKVIIFSISLFPVLGFCEPLSMTMAPTALDEPFKIKAESTAKEKRAQIASVLGKRFHWMAGGENHGNYITLNKGGEGLFGRPGHFEKIQWTLFGDRSVRFSLPLGEVSIQFSEALTSFNGIDTDGKTTVSGSLSSAGLESIFGKPFHWTSGGANHGNFMTLFEGGGGTFGTEERSGKIQWVQFGSRGVRFTLMSKNVTLEFSQDLSSFTGLDIDGETKLEGWLNSPQLEPVFGKDYKWTAGGLDHGNHLNIANDGTGVFGRQSAFTKISWTWLGGRKIVFILPAGNPIIEFSDDFKSFQGVDADRKTFVQGRHE